MQPRVDKKNLNQLLPPYVDAMKRCNYHQNQGHTTKECCKVCDLIEELVRSGPLGSFVQNDL